LFLLRTAKSDGYLRNYAPIDATNLRVGVRNLHVVHVEKIHIRMNENRSKKHCKQNQQYLCKSVACAIHQT